MPAPSLRPWEPEFIRLWESGATQAAIAEVLGIPQGTVKSRAHRLQQQGKIQVECCEQQLEQVRRTAANDRAVLEQRIADLQRLLDTGP